MELRRMPIDLSRKSRVEVKLGGFGGQGIIMAGYVLGRAASVHAGRNAVLSQSYGPESRGGACLAEVIIADGEISYPRVAAPDIMVMMSQEAYEKYALSRPAHCALIVDEDLVKPDAEAERAKVLLKAPSTRLAEELGHRMVANIVMLGVLCGATHVVDAKAMEEAVAWSVPERTVELNLKGFRAGYDHARKFLGEGDEPVAFTPETERRD